MSWIIAQTLLQRLLPKTERRLSNFSFWKKFQPSNHQYSLQLVTNNNFDLGVCDGYIITGMRNSDYEWISRIEKPVILFGENLHGYDFVDTNNKEGGMLSTRYALSLGYDKVVFVGIDLKEAFEYSR